MSDKVIIEELCCRECPENEIKRCSEQKDKYRNSINYILSFIENDENKEHITELKKRIVEPTRCDVVLEKQLQRLKKENEQLRSENLPKFNEAVIKGAANSVKYKQALKEIEEICKMNCENCQYNPNWNNQDCECEFTDECEEIKIKDIIHKINEVLKNE